MNHEEYNCYYNLAKWCKEEYSCNECKNKEDEWAKSWTKKYGVDAKNESLEFNSSRKKVS
jgi:hypothetical protein